MNNNERFETVYKQGVIDIIEILVDKQTGVNYLHRAYGHAGGLTPLLDCEGNVVVNHNKNY